MSENKPEEISEEEKLKILNNTADIQPITQESTQKEIVKSTLQNYIDLVNTAKTEKAKYLAAKEKFKIIKEDGTVKDVDRKPINNRKLFQIQKLRNAAIDFDSNKSEKGIDKVTIDGKEYTDPLDMQYDSQVLMAKYILGIEPEEYDDFIYEDDDSRTEKDEFGLRSVLDGCLLRAIHGSSFFHQSSNNVSSMTHQKKT